MNVQRFVCAAAAISMAVAAPLFGQDSTKVVFDSATLRRLPIDNALDVPVLVPGVYGLTDPRVFSVRGGFAGGAAVYVDGALIRSGQRRGTALVPPVRGIQSLAVTTGLGPVEFGETQGGLVEIVTPAGGPQWTSDVRYRADDAGPDLWRNVGFHRIEAIGGGPLPAGFTLFAAFQLDGQQSLETEKLRDVQTPVYVASGIDTIIRQPRQAGDPLSDTLDLSIPRFVQYSGYCDKSRNGADCRGLQVPFTTQGAHVFQAKLQRAYGTQGRVSLTLLSGRQQVRDFSLTALYNPTNRIASRTRNRAFIVAWAHQLPNLGGRPFRLNINLSFQTDERVSGPLTLASEAESRVPGGGFLLSSLAFVADVSTVHDVGIAGANHSGVRFLDDLQMRCLLAGIAACQDLAPFLDRTDMLSSQPYRMNPYAAEQSVRLPLYTSGLDAAFDLSRERRWSGRLGLDWKVGASHDVSAGLELARFDTRHYAAGMVSAFPVDGYAERPTRTGAYIQDRLTIGRLELQGVLRLDHFDSRALYPIVPGRISSITDTIAVSGTDTFRLTPFDPLNPTANFRRADAHSVVSPQLRMFVDAWPGATVRFAIGRQVATPNFQSLFTHKNTDLSQSNRNVAFGRNLEPGHTDLIELGAHVDLGAESASSADVTLYSQDFADEAIRLVSFSDPGGSGFPGSWRVFTTTDRGKVRGIDVSVRRRFSSVLTGSVSFSHLGGPALDAPRTFVAGSAALTFGERAPLGNLLSHTALYSIIRLSTNRHYTLLQNSGDGLTIDDGAFVPGDETSLPLFKTLDLRVTRSFSLGRVGGVAFIESKNLFNWTNLTNIFTETGEVTNDQHRARYVNEQIAQLENEAAANGLARMLPGTGEPAVDFSAPGVCAGWTSRSANFAGGPADCVLLQRAEARFGDGDKLFTRSEYSAAFGAWYDLANAPYRFYGPGRRIRVGLELGF